MKGKKREDSQRNDNTVESCKYTVISPIMPPGKKDRQGSCNASIAHRSLCRKRMRKNSSSWGSFTGNQYDASSDLRLAFSSIDETPSDQEDTPLNTFFSPIFHLFSGDTPNSSSNSIEAADDVSEKLEEAQSTLAPQDSVDTCSCVDLGSNVKEGEVCLASEAASEKNPIELADSSLLDDAPLAVSINHVTYVSPNKNELLEEQQGFDSGSTYVEWELDVENKYAIQITEQHLEDEFLNSDEASLYLAVQQSRALDGNPVITQVEVSDDLDDFDPYLFIKQLPDLSEVGSLGCPPILVPKQAEGCPPVTLVLDLDETLIHSTLEFSEDADFTFPLMINSQEYTVYVRCRPHLHTFMERVAQLFEVIVFTASQSVYAEKLLDILDPHGKLIQHRVFRDSCIFVDGNYLKDLTILGRDLSKVAIVDNSPQAFGFQVDNGIPVESWFDDKSDTGLLRLLPFLESLVGVDDVRPVITQKFHLHRKNAQAAVDH